MTTDRRFCRFNRDPDTATFSITEIPPEGLCLSAFVVLNSEENPSAVLMGHMNPAAAWDHIGALDRKRVEIHRNGWMLPSSHFIFRESPEEAARRILREQLELSAIPLEGPRVVSEVYAPKRFPEKSQHWDLEFLFRGKLSEENVPISKAWTDLRFIDTHKVPKSDIARTHEDILASAGFPLDGTGAFRTAGSGDSTGDC